jgi:hypothetical protein
MSRDVMALLLTRAKIRFNSSSFAGGVTVEVVTVMFAVLRSAAANFSAFESFSFCF